MKAVIIILAIAILGYFGVAIMGNQSIKIADQNNLSKMTTPNPTTTPTPTPTPNDFISAKKATITTAKGIIEIDLYPTDSPKTVTNFTTLAKRGYYNNLTFHRVEDWVIQGGDPTGTGAGGTSIYGTKFEDELNPNTASFKAGYVEGIVAMANAGPNTNGSQFFILTKDTPLANAYTIFGKVTKGMDVVKSIVVGDKILTITVAQ